MKNFLLFIILSSLTWTCRKNSSITQGVVNPSISGLGCPAATSTGHATSGTSYNGNITVPYFGANGAVYTNGSSISSIGVTGLTAVLQAGTLSQGTGNFIYAISGTPSSTGTATFNISFAGQSCAITLSVNEPALVQYGTPFANVSDRQDASIYQVNIRAFSSGSNFQGVIARLDSIKALGVNVIYLMPVHPVGAVNSVNSPYAVKDYLAINPEFGSLSDLRALVDGAHNRDMSVMMDWVANHTAWDNSWTNTHKDWYSQDAAGNIISPPGMGWNDVAQLNFGNSAMRLEMIKSMKYWVYSANIDGFRFDFADGPPMDFWKQAIDTLRNITSHKLLLLAEGNRSDHFAVGFDFTFGFSYYGQLKSVFNNNQPATSLNVINNTEYANAANGQQVIRYLTNHDVNSSDGTPQDLFGGLKGSMAAFVVTALMRGVPMIYNGQEVGFPNRITFPFTSIDITWGINPLVTAEYKNILGFRKASAAARRGILMTYSTANVCAFTKELGVEKVFVASNLRNFVSVFTLPLNVANSSWTDALTGAGVTLTSQITLQPYSYVVLRK